MTEAETSAQDPVEAGTQQRSQSSAPLLGEDFTATNYMSVNNFRTDEYVAEHDAYGVDKQISDDFTKL